MCGTVGVSNKNYFSEVICVGVMDPNIKSKHIKGQVQVCNVGTGQIGVKVIDSHKSHRGFDWQLGMRALSFLHWKRVTFNLSLFPLKIFSGILVVVTIAAIYSAVAQHCTAVCKLYSFIPPLVYLSILTAWRGGQDWRARMRVKRWLTLTPWKIKYANQYGTFLYYHFIGFSTKGASFESFAKFWSYCLKTFKQVTVHRARNAWFASLGSN